MDSWQKREKRRYDEAYATGEYIPENESQIYTLIFNTLNLDNIKTVLDVGCGLGYGVRRMRFRKKDAYGVDISDGPMYAWKEQGIDKYCRVTSADSLPFKDNKFDLVISTDLLEHIPCDAVPKVLMEMKRVGNSDFFFDICCGEARESMPDGSEQHLCVQHQTWWLDQLMKAGFWTPYIIRREGYLLCICLLSEKNNTKSIFTDKIETKATTLKELF